MSELQVALLPLDTAPQQVPLEVPAQMDNAAIEELWMSLFQPNGLDQL